MTIDTLGTAPTSLPRQTGTAEAAATAAIIRPAPVAAPSSGAGPAGNAPTLDEVNRAVTDLNKSPQARAQGLEFSVDSDTRRTVVKVIDQSTQEVLRQIPTQEALEMLKALDASSTKGVLIRQTA